MQSTQSCCPECGGQDFEMAGCAKGAMKLGGYTVQCIGCDWLGYRLQLTRIKTVKTAKEVAEKHNAEIDAVEALNATKKALNG